MEARAQLFDIVMAALRNTSNSPFYSDDQETIDLVDEIVDAIIAAGWPGND